MSHSSSNVGRSGGQYPCRWKGHCEDLYNDEEGEGAKLKYREHGPPLLHSEVAHAICQTASRKATRPDEVPAELFKAGEETVLDRMHSVHVWRSEKLVSDQMNGRSPRSSHFPRKVIS